MKQASLKLWLLQCLILLLSGFSGSAFAQNTEKSLRIGKEYFDQKLFPEALAYFMAARDGGYTGSDNISKMVGLCYIELGEFEQARIELLEARKQNPTDMYIPYKLALVLVELSLRNHREAVSMVEITGNTTRKFEVLDLLEDKYQNLKAQLAEMVVQPETDIFLDHEFVEQQLDKIDAAKDYLNSKDREYQDREYQDLVSQDIYNSVQNNRSLILKVCSNKKRGDSFLHRAEAAWSDATNEPNFNSIKSSALEAKRAYKQTNPIVYNRLYDVYYNTSTTFQEYRSALTKKSDDISKAEELIALADQNAIRVEGFSNQFRKYEYQVLSGRQVFSRKTIDKVKAEHQIYTDLQRELGAILMEEEELQPYWKLKYTTLKRKVDQWKKAYSGLAKVQSYLEPSSKPDKDFFSTIYRDLAAGYYINAFEDSDRLIYLFQKNYWFWEGAETIFQSRPNFKIYINKMEENSQAGRNNILFFHKSIEEKAGERFYETFTDRSNYSQKKWLAETAFAYSTHKEYFSLDDVQLKEIYEVYKNQVPPPFSDVYDGIKEVLHGASLYCCLAGFEKLVWPDDYYLEAKNKYTRAGVFFAGYLLAGGLYNLLERKAQFRQYEYRENSLVTWTSFGVALACAGTYGYMAFLDDYSDYPKIENRLEVEKNILLGLSAIFVLHAGYRLILWNPETETLFANDQRVPNRGKLALPKFKPQWGIVPIQNGVGLRFSVDF
ncbi:hypothetical protein CEE37_14445 [candidate division LCP-89 bacterium B3_LCP]|uniref:Tetratricopeptide repeat protein n=1 Tax=candidate division LCP-89 bacterium B3_LCP TaxID=2012998 RepID=A0A532UPQ2_UNCL8|nr:MAG: hypothetical protein CEE37_14445 [candidate division LCP-89 bacterium B3_LCP]